MYTPTNLASPDQIHKELTDIQLFLESDYASDLGHEVQGRFDMLGGYMARTGKLKADAEFHYNSLIESGIMNALKSGLEDRLSPMVLKQYVEALAKNYKYVLTWSERCNRAITHQYEGMRTVMSKLKEEAAAMRWQK